MRQEAASGLWRSEDMVVLMLHMQREVAHDSVLKLGQLGMFQFIDLRKDVSAFQRDFVQEVRRCDEMERKLRFLHEEVVRAEVHPSEDYVAAPETMFSLEQKVDEKEAELREMNEQYQALIEQRNRSREHMEVLRCDLGGSSSNVYGLCMLAGVIPEEKVSLLERMVYRLTRGNSVLQSIRVDTPFYNVKTNQAVIKSVFAIYYSAPYLRDKLSKLCEVNGAMLYDNVDDEHKLQQMRESLQQEVDTVTHTLQQTAARRREVLSVIANACSEWRRAVATEKAVYATMNLLHFSGSTVIAKGWAPVRSLEDIRTALREAEMSSGAQTSTIVEEVSTNSTPPTYFKTNKITSCFQGIVDSYGMARYKEVNPGVFTIVTFPYLFGVMYGDIGHGVILTAFAAFLIFAEKSWEGKPMNEIFAMIFGGRYLLFFMGLFAVYIGFLYNDMFGFSTEVFTSGYHWPPLPPDGPHGIVYPISPSGNPSVKPENPVVFGVDSAWAATENKLEFYNSLKMKCAVIIGVVQMMVGVILSLFNHLYFKQMLQVWFRFIPEVIFLTCTFGYMCLMIIMKWCTTWTNTNDAPSILETMTSFFLAPGTVTMKLYSGQETIQLILLLIAVAMVPILLCGIPYFEKKQHEEAMARRQVTLAMTCSEDGYHEAENYELGALNAGSCDGEGDEHDHFDFSEVVIHQVIHTIEYVLGCVSNTASYLRLWALSLAHSQLSEVFWDFAFLKTVDLDGGSGIFVFIGFAVWMQATIGILLGMEALSAFLHALRLHWVEFNGKFYYADGHAFQPFDLAAVLHSLD